MRARDVRNLRKSASVKGQLAIHCIRSATRGAFDAERSDGFAEDGVTTAREAWRYAQAFYDIVTKRPRQERA